MSQIVFRAIILSTFVAGQAVASGYPSYYTHQTVRTIELTHKQGSQPAFVANVTSGIVNQIILGYRDTGFLSQNRPLAVDAVIIAKCEVSPGVTLTKTSVVKIEREWNDKGYLSAPESTYYLFGSCGLDSKRELAFAFSDGHGNWDSRDGENYSVNLNDFYRPGTPTFSSHEPGDGGGLEPNQKIWTFLIDAL
ncbi:MAG: hypothetical protein IPK04_21445 [Bdellovibrionales bacterium]|nr:hypothetical protein [Bdellovibrionales bacterium]